MDPSEKDHIISNLSELIRSTKANVLLLSTLQEKGILSEADLDLLASIPSEHKKTDTLFSILYSRKHAYDAMMEALRLTLQTGALTILESLYSNTTTAPLQITTDRDTKIGEGAFSSVYKGLFGGRTIAVKEIQTRFYDMDRVRKEIDLLMRTDWHENIVRYFGCRVEGQCALIGLELCGRNLGEWVTASRGDEKVAREGILVQAASGICHLHAHGIIHMDVKPENMLVNEVGEMIRVKITDLGSSKRVEEIHSVRTSTGLGTEGWMSPEVLKRIYGDREQEITNATDVFSLGCVFYFVITDGSHPFGERVSRNHNIVNGLQSIYAEDLKYASCQDVLDLVTLMTRNDPKSRPQSHEILEALAHHHTSKAPAAVSTTTIATIKEKGKTQKQLPLRPTFSDLFESIETSDLETIAALCEAYKRHSKTPISKTIEIWKSVYQTVLHVAVTKDYSIVEYLLENQGLKHVLKEPSFLSVAHYCVRDSINLDSQEIENRVKILNLLQNADSSSITAKANDIYPHFAILAPGVHVRLLIELCELGADLSVVDYQESNILHHSSSYLSPSAYHEFTVYLIRKNKLKPLFEMRDGFGRHPLVVAVMLLEVEGRTIEVLAENVDLKNISDTDGKSLLVYAVEAGRSCELLEALSDKGKVDPEATGLPKTTVLNSAVQSGNIPALKYFGKRYPIHDEDEAVETYSELLRLSIWHEKISLDMMNALIELGAEVSLDNIIKLIEATTKDKWDVLRDWIRKGYCDDIKDTWGNTVLHLAAKKCNAEDFHEVVQLMVENGRSKALLALGKDEATVLHSVVEELEPLYETLKLFSEDGVDFNGKLRCQAFYRGYSVFMLAVRSKRSLECLKHLIEFGADCQVANEAGMAPIHLASERCASGVIEFLVREKGVEVRVADRWGYTPLHYAVDDKVDSKAARVRTIELLIRLGGEVNAKDNRERTVLALAKERGYTAGDAIEVLKAHGAVI